MTRRISDYIALAIISEIDWEDGGGLDFSFGPKAEFQGDIGEFKTFAEKRCGFPVTEDLIAGAMRTLADCGLLRVTDDNFSGTFVKVRSEQLVALIDAAAVELKNAKNEQDEIGLLTRPSDYPAASAVAKYPLIEDYHELGDKWLKRALLGIRNYYEEHGILPNQLVAPEAKNFAPGSDRIVTFTDNEANDLASQTDKIISAVEDKNSVEGEPGLREILLGQLRAGKELILAGRVRLHLFEITLIQTLQFLAKKYEHELIGAIASTLIQALAKHIGIDI